MVGKKIAYALLGLLTGALGVIGVWVPGLPTTVFILIALWAFSRSSAKIHSRFIRLPILKTAIHEAHRFQYERTIDLRTKLIAQTCAWLSFVGVAFAVRSLVLSLIVGLLALACSVFMYSTPSTRGELVLSDAD